MINKTCRVAPIAAILLVAVPAFAQSAGGHRGGGRHRQSPTTPADTNTERPQVDPWPRLEAGATLCRTLEDLKRLEDREAAGAGPAQVACHLLPRMTPVTILARSGPAATQVKLGTAENGGEWTNAYLPDRSPTPGRPPGSGR